MLSPPGDTVSLSLSLSLSLSPFCVYTETEREREGCTHIPICKCIQTRISSDDLPKGFYQNLSAVNGLFKEECTWASGKQLLAALLWPGTSIPFCMSWLGKIDKQKGFGPVARQRHTPCRRQLLSCRTALRICIRLFYSLRNHDSPIAGYFQAHGYSGSARNSSSKTPY